MANILGTIFIAAFSSFLTFQLSIMRFRSEKWWELKVSSYQNIIEALHESKLFSSLHLEAYEENAEVTEAKAEELRVKGRRASDEIAKAIDVGAFLLSERAIERLRQYMSDSSDADNATEWYEHLEMDYTATKNCLDDLIVIAKDDLDKTYIGFDISSYFKQLLEKVKSGNNA